jgi:hypothetical protein
MNQQLTAASDKKREYVLSRHLAAEIEAWVVANNSNYHQLARRAQLSPRALRIILGRQRRYQTIFLADRLMIAMGKYIYQPPSYWR